MTWKPTLDTTLMKDVYVQGLIDLAKDDPRIVLLDADLMNSNGTVEFLHAFPERTINVGVQEANMIGVAAGLAATGKIPFTHTFSCFNARRALDQIYMSVAYAHLNVKMVGTDPGVVAAFNGGTHMPLEDLGVMRGIPDMVVIEPVDSTMMRGILRQVTYENAPVYLRINRKETVQVYDEGARLTIGQGVVLRPGSDATIIASGIMVAEALEAAQALAGDGLQVRVVNLFTLKPIDAQLICACAEETGAIVTAENHNIHNGLGSAVAEVLSERYPVPLERVGVPDVFGEVGSVAYLQERFGLTARDIQTSVQRVWARKQRKG